MISFLKNTEKEKLKTLYDKRFAEKSNISCEKKIPEFYIELIDDIYKQYKIKVDEGKEPQGYKEKEKIRLRVKIESLKSNDLDTPFKYTSTFYTIIVPIIISAIGYMFTSVDKVVNFAMQNKINQYKETNGAIDINEFYNFLTDTYSNFNIGNINFVGKLIPIILFASSILICIIPMIINYKDKKDKSIEISFERMCLEVLEKMA